MKNETKDKDLIDLLEKYKSEYKKQCELYRNSKGKEKWIAEGQKHALALIINDLVSL